MARKLISRYQPCEKAKCRANCIENPNSSRLQWALYYAWLRSTKAGNNWRVGRSLFSPDQSPQTSNPPSPTKSGPFLMSRNGPFLVSAIAPIQHSSIPAFPQSLNSSILQSLNLFNSSLCPRCPLAKRVVNLAEGMGHGAVGHSEVKREALWRARLRRAASDPSNE